MNRKLTRILEPGLHRYLGCLLLFALVSAFFNIHLAIGQGVASVVIYFYFRGTAAKRHKEIIRYIESVTDDVDEAAKSTMTNSPLPMVIFRPETDEVVWSNERFLEMAGEQERLFDTKLSVAVPDFDTRWLMEGKHQNPKEVKVNDKRFLVFGHLMRTTERQGKSGFLATTYWVDITEYSTVRGEFEDSRPVVAILNIDNYEELMKSIEESERSSMLNQIGTHISQWIEGTNGLFCRYDRDHYLFVFEERYLNQFKETKFSILDAVHEVQSSNSIQTTLSIGIGKDAPSMKELFQYASLSLEMALSRGGDQAVVKNRFAFEFYGGRSKELEKRTKVKSRVMANALSELIADSSCVFVMGHKSPDMDAMGATTGVCAIARKRGIPAYIVRESGPTPADDMIKRLMAAPEYQDLFLPAGDCVIMADTRSLLVVVDTNRPEQVQSQSLLESCNRVAVIDHHRRAATYIANAALNFHEPYASSASELTTELLQYIMEPADLLRLEAECLMAGIVLDTKNYTMRTGGRTFEAAAFLRRSGADTAEVRKFFQNDLNGTIARYDIIQNARMYRGDMAIAVVDHTVGRITAAQAADELLNIAGIDTSFVLFPDGNEVCISARSMGDTNVQVILEALGGGGNGATAGAQMRDITVEEAARQLALSIDKYFETE